MKTTLMFLTVTLLAAFSAHAQKFADMRYADVGRANLAAMASGDIDKFLMPFADNAVYLYSNLDSLAGKQAIAAFWKNRRNNVIKSMSFHDQIWLPVVVETPQAGEQPGVWLLGWYRVDAVYQNGNTMTQLVHSVMHFDKDDKVDYMIQYLDWDKINKAMKN